MNYATVSDLVKLLPEETLVGLTDDDDLGVINDEIVESALETATVTIDGYLAGRYRLPLDPVPKIVTSLCVDLAGHLLFIRRDQNSVHWETRQKNAIRFLEQLADGRLTLGISEPSGTGDRETLGVSAPEPQLTNELEKY